MSREDSGDIVSDDITDISDCPGQPSNDYSHQDTNTTQIMEDSETVAEKPEILVVPHVSESHGVNWTAVDVYKIFHQFNTSSTNDQETAVISHSSNLSDLNQTLDVIRRTNFSTNISRDSAETEETREKRSAESAYYQQPLHISREDDMPVLTVAGAETGVQYHSL